MLIAVCGNLGSGKTTLAKFIAENYGFNYVPSKRLEFDFLEDFFNDIEGKFFPAQVSFLISKAIEIQSLHYERKNIVIDRSLLEDIEVFAKLWSDRKDIDRKIVKLYQHTANFITSAIPKPDIYLVCHCPAEVCAERVASRPPRKFEAMYPPNHIQILHNYYVRLTSEWNVPYIEIDTAYYDLTNSLVLESVCEHIFDRLLPTNDYGQLSLFEDTGDNTGIENQEMSGISFNNLEGRYPLSVPKPQGRYARYIYLAAPFTQLAASRSTAISDTENESFFTDDDQAQYGSLPISYRSQLIKIEKAIRRQCKLPVLLPHRDINNWGMTTYPTQHITPKIIETVEHATAMVAIPGKSIGVHMELGIAIAKKIPVIVIETKDFQNSFFLEGMRELEGIKYIKAGSLSQIPKFIEREDLLEFIFSLGGQK